MLEIVASVVLKMTSNVEDVILAAAACVILCRRRLKSKRRFWVRPSLRARGTYSGTTLLKDLAMDDIDPLTGDIKCDGSFKNFLRMTSSDFEYLINQIGHKIGKKDTTFRDAIPVKERLAVTLRFLASGDSYQSLSYLFKFSKQSISNIVPEVCDALIDCLSDKIKVPEYQEEWLQIADDFNRMWNYPQCCGSMDGKHICLQAPMNTGSDYFNYKGYFSIVLLAIVDANYCFTYVNVGCQGRLSDGGVYANTTFKQLLETSSLDLPPMKLLPGRTSPSPFVFLGDEAFALQPHIMTPFPGTQLKGSLGRIYNYRHSRARRVVENSFGILSVVFRVLRKPMLIEPERAEMIVLACCYLHNFLRKGQSSSSNCAPGTLDSEDTLTGELIPGTWRAEGQPNGTLLKLKRSPRKPSVLGKEIREEFSLFFASEEGKVSWQNNY